MQIGDILSSNPEIVSGAVVFKGTRVPVDALFENLADGLTIDEFLDSFPTVDRTQVEGALMIASDIISESFALGDPK